MKDQIGQKLTPGDIVVMNSAWGHVTIGRVRNLTEKRVMVQTISGYKYISPRMPDRVLKIEPHERLEKYIGKNEA